MGRPKILEIKAVTDSRQGVRGLKQLETSADRTQRRVSKAGRIGAAALLALGAAGIHAAKAAAADEASQTTLASAMRKNTNSTDKSIAATEKWIDRTARAKGVADDQLRPALATLVRATGSAAQAQKTLGLAMDVSAATGKPLAAVSAALAKGYAGNTTALGRLVPGISKAALKSKDMTKITAELTKKVGGDAARAAQTSEGKLRRMSVATGELEEQLGAILLPTIGTLVTGLGATAAFLQKNHQAATILLGVVAGLAAAVVTINAAFKVYTAYTRAAAAAQWLLNTAMFSNPIGIVVLAVIALGAGLVLAYKKSDKFRAIVQAAGRIGAAALGWVVDKAKAVGTWLAKLGPAASKAKDIAVKAFKLYISPITLTIDAIKKLVGWIGKIKFPKPPGWLKKAGGKIGGLFGGGGGPKTPPAAPGGSAPGWGRGGPGGGGFSIPVGGGRGGGVTYVFNVYGAVDKEGTARTIRDLLFGSDIRNGRPR